MYRSDISAYHPSRDGYKIGEHPLIRDLMKRAFNTRPPQPRYTETWDVDKVLALFNSWEDNDQLCLSDLTHKLAMLMALISASRCHELACLELQFMQDFGDKISFAIAKLTKSRRQSRPNQSISFTQYHGNPKFDVVNCFRAYLLKTNELRTSAAQQSVLFLACVKPHKPVKPCTIARWLKIIMASAGIDTNLFKAHSVRGALSSKANKFSLSTQQIIDRANWSKARTFYRFYFRSTPSDQFQDKVLQTS